MKKGLILEGGAMRGMFSAGVMDVMMENGITFDGAVGVSAGAAFGCNYKSGQNGRVIRYNTRFCRDKRYCGIRSLIKTGDLYSADFCYGEVPEKLDIFDLEAYENNPMEFYVVCTDIESGKPVYHKYTGWDDHGFDWIRASASLPLVARIVEIDGRKLLDGGMTDSIPLKFFESMGYDKNVVILTQPDGYRKEQTKTLPLIKRCYRKYPNLIKAIAERHIMYNAELDYISQKGKDIFLIQPQNPLMIGRVEKNPEKLRQVYEIGRKEAERNMESLMKYLNEDR